MTSTAPALNPEGKYTVGKIAKALEVSRQSVYNYHKDGRLKLRLSKGNVRFAYGWEVNKFYDRYL